MGTSDIDRAFESQLSRADNSNVGDLVFNLGRPSKKLLSAGIEDKQVKLYGAKLPKKMAKHGYTLADLRGLSKAFRNPIAVFRTLNNNSSAVLTTLRTSQGNMLVTLNVGKGQDSDFNIVSSVYGKSNDSIVKWINEGKLKYVDKKKALNYLRSTALIAVTADSQGLFTAANIVRNYKNSKFFGKNLSGVVK